MKNLYAYIKQTTGLSEQGWGALRKILRIRHFKSGEDILKKGQVSDFIFYIIRGYCRAFYEFDGKIINTNFYFEKDFATNLRSLKQEIGSEYTIRAEEDMKVVIFDKEKLYELFSRSLEVDAMGRKLMEDVVARQEEQAFLFKLNSARERYDYMCRIQPKVIEKIPLTQIASYLGISLDTLLSIHEEK